MDTMNKTALAEKVLEFDNFETKKQAIEFVEDFFKIIRDTVAEGNAVSIPGFGKFEPYTRQNGTVKPKFVPFTAFKEQLTAK